MKIKSILVSQPQPADISKTPYGDLMKKYGVTFTFEKFIKLDGVTASELRQEHVKLPDYTGIILTSRNAVDHFFRIAKEMRYNIPETLKYFCINESTALYLQRYVQYRKRKVFYGNQTINDLIDIMKKHRDEKYLYCCSDITSDSTTEMLTAAKLNYTKAVMFRTVPADLKNIKIEDYDMLVFFSPAGIVSLKTNFPGFVQKDVCIAGFGDATCQAIVDAGYDLTFKAPTDTAPSMTMAIEEFLAAEAKKNRKK
ncbi:MAG: uroporphyrinogen-III synthase [Bacteroidales bacterium]|nr:uroporphyrinogen-III synthase [Bacteroidales bacterium]MBR0539222.1 uroporphyrinogen-III synthase [Bacteroidales bacterium]